MLSVLLYGAECWKSLKRHLHKLNIFNHGYFRAILGVQVDSNEARKEKFEGNGG